MATNPFAMMFSFDNTTSICIVEDDDTWSLLGNINSAKLIKFSVIAESCMRQGGAQDPKFPSGSVVIAKGLADAESAVRIMEWIDNNDMENPKPLTLEVLKIDQFDDVVNIYRTAHALALRREHRGDDVRDAIYDYVQSTPLAFDEFARVMEHLAFDTGITKTTMHRVMWGKLKGGAFACPEMQLIEQYAQQTGLWEKMVEIEEEIAAKLKWKEDQQQAKQERFKQDQERRAARQPMSFEEFVKTVVGGGGN